MEQLKSMKQCLMAQAQGQMGNLQAVDANELGAVIDMIKDLEEACYYASITKAMEEGQKEEEIRHYSEKMMPYRYDGPRYYDGISYYGEGSSNSGNNSSSSGNGRGMSYYNERPMMMRDSREGNSPMSRKMYMEAKEMHKPTGKELEKYAQELTNDIIEMIQDASPEEKKMLQQKITTLASKIV